MASSGWHKRWMVFVDGENFTIRLQNVASAEGIALVDGPYAEKDFFAWTFKHGYFGPSGILA
jgi:hypothetical protein